ncbi:MAG: nitrate reductase [Actinobacteria bacterium]|nr:nitrate reductase [Actinomycetota bacterium]
MLSDGRRGQPSQERARVRAWCREALDLPPHVTVLVTELACDDPDCPDVETVIALLEEGDDPRTARIFLPAAEVTEAHVYTALAQLTETHEE